MSFINVTLKVNDSTDSAIAEILEAISQFTDSILVDYQLTESKSENNKLSGVIFSKKDAEILKKFAESKQVIIEDKKKTIKNV